MPGRVQGKVCAITGGGSGIGRAACLLFAREGAHVAVVDKNAGAAERVAAEAGAGALAITCDVSDSAAVKSTLETVVAGFGRLDVLVNNAGYGIAGTVVETSEADWAALMAVNVNGVFYGSKHAVPIMRRQGGGVIINTASVVASVGVRNRAAYCASKGAVVALTRAMAIDHVGDNIRINCIAPGTIGSPYFDDILRQSGRAAELKRELEHRQAMNRLGRPEEVAAGLLFLASDESSFATGSVLTIDGGMTAQVREPE